jgi:hypothetical protein
MRLLFLTNDKYLYRKAELELKDKARLSSDASLPFDIALVDLRTHSADGIDNALTVSDGRDDADLYLPLKRGALLSVIGNAGNSERARLSILPESKAAILDGRTVKLTSHEYALLSVLMSGNGEFISRERISDEVWGDAGDGLINIYIHYLREKLETLDEKIIISSRKLGYKINKAYLEVRNADSD